MARLDMPLEELRRYRPEVREPEDFDEFWSQTLGESRAVAGQVEVTPIDTPLTVVDTYDVTFSGFAGDPIRGWFTVPHGAEGPLPGVVEYIGYNGGRGLAHQAAGWALAGFAYLRMDNRGQGGGWNPGATVDPHGSGPAYPGVMTRGIESRYTYYYRRLITDAVMAVDALRQLPQVDESRVSAVGGSQGGGLTIAVAGLAEGLTAVMPDFPFLCNFERAIGFNDGNSYEEWDRYLRAQRDMADTAFQTLSYIDGVNFAKRATAPALFSTGLEDPSCPPSTAFAAFNHYGDRVSEERGPGMVNKEIVVYPFNEHEGGGEHHWPKQVDFVRGLLGDGD